MVPNNSYYSLPVVLKPATPFRLASWLKFKLPRRSGEAAAAAFRIGGWWAEVQLPKAENVWGVNPEAGARLWGYWSTDLASVTTRNDEGGSNDVKSVGTGLCKKTDAL